MSDPVSVLIPCWCLAGSDLPSQAGQMALSDIPGTWSCPRGGPHVWSGLPSVRHLWHPIHHDTEAMSLDQRATQQWVVDKFVEWLSAGTCVSNPAEFDRKHLKARLIVGCIVHGLNNWFQLVVTGLKIISWFILLLESNKLPKIIFLTQVCHRQEL